MTTKWLVSLALLVLTAGCATYQREDFRITHASEQNTDAYVLSTIYSKKQKRGSPPLYGSYRYSAPYYLSITVYSSSKPELGLLIYSMSLKEGATTVFASSPETPRRIGLELKGHNHTHPYRARFGKALPDSLEFADGKELVLTIDWAIPGIVDRQVYESSFIGKKSRERVPLMTDI